MQMDLVAIFTIAGRIPMFGCLTLNNAKMCRTRPPRIRDWIVGQLEPQIITAAYLNNCVVWVILDTRNAHLRCGYAAYVAPSLEMQTRLHTNATSARACMREPRPRLAR